MQHNLMCRPRCAAYRCLTQAHSSTDIEYCRNILRKSESPSMRRKEAQNTLQGLDLDRPYRCREKWRYPPQFAAHAIVPFFFNNHVHRSQLSEMQFALVSIRTTSHEAFQKELKLTFKQTIRPHLSCHLVPAKLLCKPACTS